MALVITSFLFTSFPSMNSVPRKWNDRRESTPSPMELAPYNRLSTAQRPLQRSGQDVPGSLHLHIRNKWQQHWDRCPSVLPGESSWADATWQWVLPQGQARSFLLLCDHTAAWQREWLLKDIFILHVTEYLTHLHLSHKQLFWKLS